MITCAGAFIAPADSSAAGPGAEPTIQAIAGQTAHGTDGPDVIRGAEFDDIIFGHGGGDVICGGAGDDVLYGDEQADTNDRFYGGAGDDALIGGPGANLLFGGAGAGRLRGGSDPPGNVKRDRCDEGKGSDVTFPGSCEVLIAIGKEEFFL